MRVLTETITENGGNIICMMQNSASNKTLFDRTPGVMCNGDLIIGSIVTIFNPFPIEDDLSGMPMIKSEEQAILCESKRHFAVPFDKNRQANETKF